MSARTTYHVTDPDESPAAVMSGEHGDIPIVAFGTYPTEVEVQVNTNLLTPAEQVAYLRRLAASVESLAEQVERAG